ncbi:hypothetical protein V6N13_145930 [Hibiscus sabdariffa]|uniref:Uncharacterized protein n=1 Tax=Hibiscus sabdariffa TaxID=183260 RepID=A0ABR2TR84_9ROSI
MLPLPLPLQAKNDLKNKDELLVYTIVNVKDTYPNVVEDLAGSESCPWPQARFGIYPIVTRREDIVFPDDPHPRATMKLDDELKGLFRLIELPSARHVRYRQKKME